MSHESSHYLLLALPESVSPDSKILSQWLEQNVNGGGVEVSTFDIPKFKVGTLDSLVVQSEELNKLDSQLSGSVQKVLDIISTIYDEKSNSDSKNSLIMKKARVVESKPVEDFVSSFRWNSSRFRVEKPIEELIKIISTDALNLDNDLRSSYSKYNVAKSNLIAAQRKQTGDLSVKSLHDIVKASDFVLDSEHLQTLLLVIPKSLQNQFLNNYETLTEFVVPRSAKLITHDSEFFLYSVTLFKKYVSSFLAAAREQKWIPREFEYSEEIINTMRDEYTNASKAEATLKNDLIRLSKTAYSDIVNDWFHLKALRVFVESVLRYGLPPNFYSFLLKLEEKNLKSAKDELIHKYGYLGGNAFTTDKNGKVLKDTSLHEYASLVDTEYEPFVLYDVELY
ncbi:unnamed protein product [[Candida] boidinii]|nr:unnamed protein product [[Candida] boidinii]